MKKIAGLSLCILLIFSFSSVAQTVVNNPLAEKTLIDDDVPTWKINDFWNYEIDEFLFQLNMSGQFIELGLNTEELEISVGSQPATSHQLDISGKLKGEFLYDDGAGMRLGGNLYFTRISGFANIREADLAAENEEIVISTIALLTEHPLEIPVPIPIPLRITLAIEQLTPRPLIDFPLFDGKIGILPGLSISANITVESIVLKILHLFIPEIPDVISLETVIHLPQILYSASVEEITVKAGNYTAYNIDFYEGLLGSIYYAPEAGSLIKAVASLDIPDELLVSFNGELQATNYIP